MRTVAALALCLFTFGLRAEIVCDCDPTRPETLKERQCSLCAVAEQQPPGILFFTIEDASAQKPNRMLALPREHSPGIHQISALPAATRAALWKGAIDTAKERWGDRWGVAYNAEQLHTQCHVHIHIGRLIEGVEWGEFVVVDKPEDIPLPGSNGLWIHPVAGKLHVHTGDRDCENVLLR